MLKNSKKKLDKILSNNRLTTLEGSLQIIFGLPIIILFISFTFSSFIFVSFSCMRVSDPPKVHYSSAKQNLLQFEYHFLSNLKKLNTKEHIQWPSIRTVSLQMLTSDISIAKLFSLFLIKHHHLNK